MRYAIFLIFMLSILHIRAEGCRDSLTLTVCPVSNYDTTIPEFNVNVGDAIIFLNTETKYDTFVLKPENSLLVSINKGALHIKIVEQRDLNNSVMCHDSMECAKTTHYSHKDQDTESCTKSSIWSFVAAALFSILFFLLLGWWAKLTGYLK